MERYAGVGCVVWRDRRSRWMGSRGKRLMSLKELVGLAGLAGGREVVAFRTVSHRNRVECQHKHRR